MRVRQFLHLQDFLDIVDLQRTGSYCFWDLPPFIPTPRKREKCIRPVICIFFQCLLLGYVFVVVL